MQLVDLFLSESVSNQAAFEQIARMTIAALSHKSFKTLPLRFNAMQEVSTQPGWSTIERDGLDAHDFPGISLGDVFPNRRGVSKFPPDIQAFIKALQKMRIGIGDPRNAGGTYSSGIFPEIILAVNSNMMKDINVQLASGHLTPHTVWSCLSERQTTLVHELVHAYDDWKSNGKWKNNSRTAAAVSARIAAWGNKLPPEVAAKKYLTYLRDPIEINARYAGTIAALRAAHVEIGNKPWKETLWQFKDEFTGWKDIDPEDRLRLIKRLAAEWTATQRPKQDYNEAVKLFEEKLRTHFGVRVDLRYWDTASALSVSYFDTKDKAKIDAILRQVMRFADIRRLIVCTSELKLTPDLKALGFVPNKGRHKLYQLPFSTTIYRAARRARN